jgi:RNA polymerase sigma-70 factor (ECF subfamily)
VDQGDRTGFESLYRENVRALQAYALTRTSSTEAHDAVSRMFLVAWRRFDDVPADPLPWLIGVARRILADQRRAEARRAAFAVRLTQEPVATQASHDDVAAAIVMRGSIREALSRLRSEDREVLILVAWHGFTTEQLATALGCSKPVASLRLHRARRRFARHLADGDGALTVPQPVIRPAKENP